VTIIDLTSIDFKDKFKLFASNSYYKPSFLLEFEIVNSNFNSAQDSKYICKKMLSLHAKCLAFALLNFVNATNTLLNSL